MCCGKAARLGQSEVGAATQRCYLSVPLTSNKSFFAARKRISSIVYAKPPPNAINSATPDPVTSGL